MDISAAISSALLMNETQWVGLVIKPLDYSLKGAVLHIEAGPELVVEKSILVEIESLCDSTVESKDPNDCGKDSTSSLVHSSKLMIEDNRIKLPDWASNLSSIVWLPVRAVSNEVARGTSTGCFFLFFL